MAPQRHWPWYLLIAAGVLLVFGQTFGFDFVLWDDSALIYKNPFVNPPELHRMVIAWTQAHGHLYIPLTYNLWALLAMAGQTATPDIFGATLNPFLFHIANVLVHLSSAILLYHIVLLLIPRKPIAAAAALIWAIHPLQVEAVVWCTGMKDVLSSALSMLAIWLYLLAASKHPWASDTRRRDILCVLAGVAMLVATFAKPGVIGIPAFVIAIDLLILCRPWRTVLRSATPMLLAIVPSIILTQTAQPVTGAFFITAPWTRPLIAAHALSVYLQKLVWPNAFAIQYDLAPTHVMQGHWVYFAWLVPLSVTLAILAYGKGRRFLLAAWLMFLAGVGPVLGLVPFVFQFFSTVADRYVYMSMVGAALAFAWILWQLKPRVAIPIATVICLGLAVRSYVQAATWSDAMALANHTVAVNPRSAIGYGHAAVCLFNEQKALAHDAQSLPESAAREALFSQAAIKRQQSTSLFLKSLEFNPNDVTSFNNLGLIYAEEGRLEDSLVMLEKAVDALERMPAILTPPTVDRLNIAKACINLKHYERAINHLHRYLITHPNDPEAITVLQQAQSLATQSTTQP